MTLAELIVTEARERGLHHIFGLPGGGSPLDMMEAGRQLGIDFVSVAHESSAAIMAAYYGLMKDTAGLALAVKGVGAGNLAAGAANAYFERVPVVCLCESAPTQVTQPELVQTCDHAGLFGSVTKYQATLNAQEGNTAVQQAVFHATDGRPGPVLLNLPSDLGLAECAAPLPGQASPSPASPDATHLEAAGQFIAAARRPLIIAGADIVRTGTTAELATLVDNIQAAVLVNMDARGVFPESHGRWAGVLVGTYGPNIIESAMLSQADAVLLIGADAMMSHVPWPSELPTCELVARSSYHTLTPAPQVRVDGDLKITLQGLSNLIQPGFPVDQIQATRQQILQYFKRPEQAQLAVQDLIEIVHELMPAEGILFSETGILICALEHLYRVERPRTYYGTAGGRTMGLMLPAVLGAKLSAPATPMVGFGADGSLLMRLGELETFARTGVAVPLVIVNDQALGTMKSRQKSRGMPQFSLDLHSVNFAQIAAACGLRSTAVETPEQFRTALKEAMQADRTTLIDARVDAAAYQESFGPMIGVLPEGD
jgi:acetolactate synthase-1/2/3 large subunit